MWWCGYIVIFQRKCYLSIYYILFQKSIFLAGSQVLLIKESPLNETQITQTLKQIQTNLWWFPLHQTETAGNRTELWAETHNPRRLGPSAGEPCSRGPARSDRAAATTAYGPGAAPNLRVYSRTHKLEEVRVDGQVKRTTQCKRIRILRSAWPMMHLR